MDAPNWSAQPGEASHFYYDENRLIQYRYTEGGTTRYRDYTFDALGRAKSMSENGTTNTLKYDLFQNMIAYGDFAANKVNGMKRELNKLN